MGAVYQAHDRVQDKTVALKILAVAPQDSQTRFRREFRVMQRLEHPHIVPSFDSGIHNAMPYLVMDYIAGGNLQENISHGVQKLEQLPQRLSIALQLCQALSYIHAQGIIHRDLKPDNIMLQHALEPETAAHVLLMDFGLVKVHSESTALTQAGVIMGTAGYMSPEQAKGGEVDARSDLYALGCVLYWLMTGKAPYQGRSAAQVLVQQLRSPAPSLKQRIPFIPDALDMLVVRLLEKIPSDRYSNASDVMDKLRAVLLELQDSILKDNPQAQAILPSVSAVEAIPPTLLEDVTPAQLFNAPLIGRAAEMQLLRQRLLQPLSTPHLIPRHLIIEAEMGLGSSRILAEIRREARQEQMHVMYMRQHRGVVAPYQIWRDALTRLRQKYPDIFAEMSAGLESNLNHLLPDLTKGSTLPDLSAEQAQNRLYDSVDMLISRWAQLHPFLLIIDNIEALDQASLGLLVYLLKGRSQHHIRSLLSWHRNPQMTLTGQHIPTSLGELMLEPLPLNPLSDKAMVELIQALLGGDAVDERLEHYLLEHAAGSPFFVTEILTSLLKAKQIQRKAKAWLWNRSRASIPPSIGDIFVERLEALPNDVQRTALAASAIGRNFHFEMLLQLVRQSEDELLDNLDALLRAGLIHEIGEDSYRFVNTLLREVLHQRLFHRSRMRYHEIIAEVLLQQEPLPVAQLADHYAETRHPKRAVPYALQAGDEAEKIYANDISESYYRLALAQLEPTDAHWAALQLKLGKVLERIGRWAEAEELYRAIENDKNYRPRALHALGKLYQRQGELAQSEKYLRQALASSEVKLAIYSDLGRTLTYKAELVEARAIYQEALTVAQNLQNLSEKEQKRMLARAQLDLGVLEHYCNNREEAIDWLQQAESLISLEVDRFISAKIKHTLGICYQELSQLDKAKDAFNTAHHIYESIGEVEPALSTLNNLATNAFYQGDLLEARRLFQNVAARAYQLGEKRMQAIALSNQGLIALDWGEFKISADCLRQAAEIFSSLGFTYHQIHSYTGIITALTRQYNYQEAASFIEKAQESLEENPHDTYQSLLNLTKGEWKMRQGYYHEAIELFNTVTSHKKEVDVETVIEAYIFTLTSLWKSEQTLDIDNIFTQLKKLLAEQHYPILELRARYAYANYQNDYETLETLREQYQAQNLHHYIYLFTKLPPQSTQLV